VLMQFIRPAMELASRNQNVLVLEQQHAQGYKKHPMKDSEVEEWESELVSDEEQWEQQFADSRDELRKMAQEAAAEYRAGKTRPMEFDSEGKPSR